MLETLCIQKLDLQGKDFYSLCLLKKVGGDTSEKFFQGYTRKILCITMYCFEFLKEKECYIFVFFLKFSKNFLFELSRWDGSLEKKSIVNFLFEISRWSSHKNEFW